MVHFRPYKVIVVLENLYDKWTSKVLKRLKDLNPVLSPDEQAFDVFGGSVHKLSLMVQGGFESSNLETIASVVVVPCLHAESVLLDSVDLEANHNSS